MSALVRRIRERVAQSERERGVVLVEYALLLTIIAVAMIPTLTAFAVVTDRYMRRQIANVEQAEIKSAQAQDELIAYMDERIAYLVCLVNLTPPQPASDCGAAPDPS